MHGTEHMPTSVRVTDITARDGFQNIKEWIPTEVKIAVIDALAAAGVRKMEATSFVSPKAVPQMADAAQVIEHCRNHLPQVELVALAPNLRGAENAAKAGVPEISYVVSASAAHNKANINRTHDESLSDLAAIGEAFPSLKINLSMSTVFGCPFDGETPVEKVLWLLEESVKRGAGSVTLCDTIGVANPRQVAAVVEAVKAQFPRLPLALHLHDTHGMGLANTLAALQAGVDCFETAAGGLGGCPFAPGAAGNTSTEDMVNMLHRMGVATGLDMEKYLSAVAIVREKVNPAIPGRLASARTYSEFCFFSCA
ncbi:MAG: hydroxymethylglutaryl-CoA lyase [Candidatus Adiutrix sp.]|jgi:hydroxymethylglutaryl-CoA lyase|nr:hydroxymethylglutaryl-CoA lyase [Candidatus Adiutrix sp.]